MSPRHPTRRRLAALSTLLALAGIAAACTSPGAATTPSPSGEMMEPSPAASGEMMDHSPAASGEMMEEPSASTAP